MHQDSLERSECVFVVEVKTLVVLQACPGCERVLGVPPSRVIGRPVTQWLDPAVRTDLANALSVLSRAVSGRHFVLKQGKLELLARSRPANPGQAELTLRGPAPDPCLMSNS